MKKIVYLLLTVSGVACTQNVWISKSAVRPKTPKFSILKEPFIGNSFIDTNYMYISTKQFLNYDGNVILKAAGFYANGRMIGNSYYKSNIDSDVYETNKWETANNIGYYTTKGNTIKYQYFVPYGGGEYHTNVGIIKQDTIIVRDIIKVKSDDIYDTLIKSNYPLK
jgi:hypothetical protein